MLVLGVRSSGDIGLSHVRVLHVVLLGVMFYLAVVSMICQFCE